MNAQPNWRDRAQALQLRTQAFINGRYTPSISGGTFDCVNPATGESLAQVSACETRDVDLAVAAARAAFRKGSWAHQSPAARKKVLLRFAELIRANAEELALLETLDVGKPIRDSLNVDLPATARCIQ